MASFRNLSRAEEMRRRHAVTPFIRMQRQQRRAFYWFQVARQRIRNGSQYRELWIERYAKLFGYGEYYQLLKTL